MWNVIIQKKAHALLNIPDLGVLYPFSLTDKEGSLINRAVNFTVSWNVMPKVGALYTRRKSFGPFSLPSEYQGEVPRPRVASMIYRDGSIDEDEFGFYMY